jgi:hypothetical protein
MLESQQLGLDDYPVAEEYVARDRLLKL